MGVRGKCREGGASRLSAEQGTQSQDLGIRTWTTQVTSPWTRWFLRYCLILTCYHLTLWCCLYMLQMASTLDSILAMPIKIQNVHTCQSTLRYLFYGHICTNSCVRTCVSTHLWTDSHCSTVYDTRLKTLSLGGWVDGLYSLSKRRTTMQWARGGRGGRGGSSSSSLHLPIWETVHNVFLGGEKSKACVCVFCARRKSLWRSNSNS